MKNWTIKFKDARRAQRQMYAETIEEVQEYISRKYNTIEFWVSETKKEEER